MNRALIVEDSSAFSKLFLLIVRHLGYATELHRGIVGARSACDGKRFDLYVVDIRIQASEAGGDGDGLEFVRWLRERHADAKVIVCSSDFDRADEARLLGCEFVAKGPNLALQLRAAVARSAE